LQPVAYSVVAPMHNEQGNVLALFDDIKRVMEGLGQPYEIIFVNDASTDETLLEMKQIQGRDAHFHYIDLQHNVGENWALLAGISKTRGAVVITIDGDYQNDPAYIPALLNKLSQGYRVVSGRRTDRAAPFWSRRLPSRVANGLIRLVSGVSVHDCGCGLKAYQREVLEGKFVPKGFMNRFSPVSLGVRGDEFSEVEIVDRARMSGASHYGLSRVFIVLRDLWALPFALRGAATWLKRFRIALGSVLAGAMAFVVTGHWLWAGLCCLLGLIFYSNVINLSQFVEAQVKPLFRIREFR
jgi:glycosyltransferase involved in cell wall biosynthesis